MITFEKHPEQIEIIRAQLKEHYESDEIVKGRYWENGKGCAVGCILHSDQHIEFEERFDIPEWVARLVDTLFEGTPNEKAKEFPLEFWDAVAKWRGKDLTSVKWKFLAFLMRENIEIVDKLEIEKELKDQVLSAIKRCEDLFISGDPSEEDLTAAESAAWSAWSAARSAAGSAARSAAESAESAWSARSAAWSAARSAAESAAWSAWSARSAALSAVYEKYTNEFLKLLNEGE